MNYLKKYGITQEEITELKEIYEVSLKSRYKLY